jgi:hypothetical protein
MLSSDSVAELTPSCETASRSATQEFLTIWWNQKVHYRVYNSGPYPEPDQSSPYHLILPA